jgi:NCS1 family nucleobase:cation symporter-1
MALKGTLAALHQRIKLKGDDEKHEQTDAWSNRDLIPYAEPRAWFLVIPC